MNLSILEITDSWEVAEDCGPTASLDIYDMYFRSFLKGVEMRPNLYINGNLVRERAIKMKGNLGLEDCQHFLDHQDQIPVALRGKRIVFTGTVMYNLSRRRQMAYLEWSKDRCRWDRKFHDVDNCVWCGSCLLPCTK